MTPRTVQGHKYISQAPARMCDLCSRREYNLIYNSPRPYTSIDLAGNLSEKVISWSRHSWSLVLEEQGIFALIVAAICWTVWRKMARNVRNWQFAAPIADFRRDLPAATSLPGKQFPRTKISFLASGRDAPGELSPDSPH